LLLRRLRLRRLSRNLSSRRLQLSRGRKSRRHLWRSQFRLPLGSKALKRMHCHLFGLVLHRERSHLLFPQTLSVCRPLNGLEDTPGSH
jgi:hypothetical protein